MHHFIYWNLSVFTTTNLFYCLPNWNYLVSFQRYYHFIILSHYFYSNLEAWFWIGMYYFNNFNNLLVHLCAFYEDNMKALSWRIVVVNHGWMVTCYH